MPQEHTTDKEADESLSTAAATGDAVESTSTQGDNANDKSILDFVKDGLKSQNVEVVSDATETEDEQSDSKIETDAEKEKKASDAQDKEGQEKEQKADGEKEDAEGKEKEEADKQEDKQPVPYERFHEVVQKREELETRLKEVEPAMKSYENIVTFCQQNDITPDQFNKAMTIQGLLNTNPAEALKHLLPIVEELQGFTGGKLPEDLQKKVDAGTIELEDAKELASLRAKSKFGETMNKHRSKAAQEAQQMRVEEEINNEASRWETAKRTSDPDYKPKAKESDPDGKWELVRDKYTAMVNQKTRDARGNVVFVHQVSSAKDMLELLEKAYQSVNGSFSLLRGRKPATKKSLSSNGSSSTKDNVPVEEAKTMREGVLAGLKQRGYSVE